MPALSTSKSYNPVLFTHLTNPGPHRLRPHCRPSFVFVRTVNGSRALLRSSHGLSMLCRPKLQATPETKQLQEQEDDEDFVLLAKMKSPFNDIMIVDSPSSRMLLLDTSFCVHSVLYKGKKWSDSYWDEFASLPPIVPKGPIAILGLGGGTSAHLMLDLWPELQLEGWEIDKILIDCARDHFGLDDLEKPTESGGVLNIHIGDALSPSINIPGGYAGIIVDLFSKADVLPQLKQVSTWLKLKKFLMPNGRFMVNCGGTVADAELATTSLRNTSLVQNSTIKALSKAFPGQLSWKIKPKEFGANQMALTGPMPDLESWSAMVPGPLSSLVKDWLPFSDC